MVTASFAVNRSSILTDAGMWMARYRAVLVAVSVKPLRSLKMLLYMKDKLERLGMTYHQFFEVAYQWRFNPGQLPSLHDDYAQFLLHSVIPKYVVDYLKHLQRSETCTAPSVIETSGNSQPSSSLQPSALEGTASL
jgi:hypothetical protein